MKQGKYLDEGVKSETISESTVNYDSSVINP